jgi:hypothetical protein
MFPMYIYLITIGALAAILFLLVDHIEGDSRVGFLLKFLVLAAGGVAIMHKVLPLFGVVL